MRLKWLTSGAIIECEHAEGHGPIMRLYNGVIEHADGSVSKFDYLILQKEEAQKIEEVKAQEQKKEGGRPPRRGRRSS